MAIQITTWSPSTCDCTFQYSWDDTTSEADRVHTFFAAVKVCSFHQDLLLPPPSQPATATLAAAPDKDKHIEMIDKRLAILNEIVTRNEKRVIAEAQERADAKIAAVTAAVRTAKADADVAVVHPTIQKVLEEKAQSTINEVEITKNRMATRTSEIILQFAEILAQPFVLAAEPAYNAVLEENQRHGQTIDQLMTQFSTELTNTDGSGLKDGVKLGYSGTAPNRVLTVTTGNLLNTTKKNQFQNAINARFGTGKIVIQ